MRRLVACTVAITLPVLTPAPSVIASSSSRTIQDSHDSQYIDVVDTLVFHTPLQHFRRERSRMKQTHRWLITRTDGCSAPLVGSSGASFNFRLACERHDLAYTNYSALQRWGHDVVWNANLRAAVDDQFQRDLQQSCITRRRTQRLRCDAWVVVFFHAVRVSAGP